MLVQVLVLVVVVGVVVGGARSVGKVALAVSVAVVPPPCPQTTRRRRKTDFFLGGSSAGRRWPLLTDALSAYLLGLVDSAKIPRSKNIGMRGKLPP